MSHLLPVSSSNSRRSIPAACRFAHHHRIHRPVIHPHLPLQPLPTRCHMESPVDALPCRRTLRRHHLPAQFTSTIRLPPRAHLTCLLREVIQHSRPLAILSLLNSTLIPTLCRASIPMDPGRLHVDLRPHLDHRGKENIAMETPPTPPTITSTTHRGGAKVEDDTICLLYYLLPNVVF